MVRLSMNCKNIYKEIGKRFKENREIRGEEMMKATF